MKTHESNYTFQHLSVDDTVDAAGANTIEFNNDGEQNVVIDSFLILVPGTSKKFGGRLEVQIKQEFNIEFDGAGKKLCQIVFENITSIS